MTTHSTIGEEKESGTREEICSVAAIPGNTPSRAPEAATMGIIFERIDPLMPELLTHVDAQTF